MHFEKLSEKTLGDILSRFYTEIKSQYTFQGVGRKFRVDYFIPSINTAFEFDGPTHFQQTHTQIRDLELETLLEKEGINLVRFPYFVQFDERTLSSLSDGKLILPEEKYTTEYKHGFHDDKIVFPADFNTFGWKIFSDFITTKVHVSVAQEILSSLDVKDPRLAFGVDFLFHPSKEVIRRAR